MQFVRLALKIASHYAIKLCVVFLQVWASASHERTLLNDSSKKSAVMYYIYTPLTFDFTTFKIISKYFRIKSSLFHKAIMQNLRICRVCLIQNRCFAIAQHDKA